jgi:hypothetical protein
MAFFNRRRHHAYIYEHLMTVVVRNEGREMSGGANMNKGNRVFCLI